MHHNAPTTLPSRSSVGALRLRRSPLRGVAPMVASLAVAGALLAARPTPAEAAGPIYEMCVDLVDGWYETCSANANWYEEYGCQWVAGVGYIACGMIGAAELGWPIIVKL